MNILNRPATGGKKSGMKKVGYPAKKSPGTPSEKVSMAEASKGPLDATVKTYQEKQRTGQLRGNEGNQFLEGIKKKGR